MIAEQKPSSSLSTDSMFSGLSVIADTSIPKMSTDHSMISSFPTVPTAPILQTSTEQLKIEPSSSATALSVPIVESNNTISQPPQAKKKSNFSSLYAAEVIFLSEDFSSSKSMYFCVFLGKKF